MKVLINAEDALLHKNLTRWGYDVATASSGQDALRQLTQDDSPKLAILDCEMNGLRGPELCERLRTKASEPYIYIILLMEKSQADDLLEAFEHGADDYLVKPFDGYELRAKLIVAKRILGLQDRLISMRDELMVQATRDALTGLWNRRASMDSLARELARAGRERTNLGIVMADIDHFKKINDTYGHLAGDQVLQAVAAKLKNIMRSYDTIGRYGGEEFLIVSPGCDRDVMARRAEHLKACVASEPVVTAEGSIPVSISMGVAIAAGQVAPEELLKAADEALYRAKRGGRDRVVLAG